MRFTISKERLLKSLLIAAKAIGSKSANPTLLCYKIEMNAGGLEITSSNADISVWTSVPVTENGEEIIRNSSFGSILINAHILTEVVRKLGGEEVSVEIIDGVIAQLDDGKSFFRLNCMNADEYPDIDMEKPGLPFSVSGADLELLVDQTAFAALDKDTRPVLTAINLRAEGGKLTATATDSARLSRKSVDIDEGLRFSVNVPAKTLIDVTNLFDPGTDVEVSASGEKVVFAFGNTLVRSRLIGGDYPISPSIVPQNFNHFLNANSRELLSAIDRVSVLSTDRSSIVRLSMSADGVSVSSSGDQIGNGSDPLNETEFSGEPLEISFNALFVSQAVRALGSEDVVFSFVGEMKPFVIKNPEDDSVIELVTPIRTR